MLSIKLLDDFLIKENDIKTFRLQLLRDGVPNPILEGCTPTLILGMKDGVLERELRVVNAEEAIVEFTFKADLGVYSPDFEVVVTNNDDIHLTYPDTGTGKLRVSASLNTKAISAITKSEYSKLNERIDELEDTIVNGDFGCDVDLENYATKDDLDGKLNEEQALALINQQLGVIENGSY